VDWGPLRATNGSSQERSRRYGKQQTKKRGTKEYQESRQSRKAKTNAKASSKENPHGPGKTGRQSEKMTTINSSGREACERISSHARRRRMKRSADK
jgi:hypothetical protein